MPESLHVGILLNPYAGLGGSLALKGSDGARAQALFKSLSDDQRQRAAQRFERALRQLSDDVSHLRFSAWGGQMGAELLQSLGFPCAVLGCPKTNETGPSDTHEALQHLCAAGIDLLLFVGGDGTARDVHDVVKDRLPTLGIPSGVKMQSGVFALSPEAAGELLHRLARGGLVDLQRREVRDIDEQALREGSVRSRFYGELLVPGEARFLQQTKIGGREDPQLAAADIGAWLAEQIEQDCTYLVGPGTTMAAFMEAMSLPNTLLGVDILRNEQVLKHDADEQAILAALASAPGAVKLLVSVTGGQGYVFGRGNQQFSPKVIRKVGRGGIVITAAKSKLASLEKRPLLVDTNDPRLDLELCGFWPVVTGYDDQVFYRLGDPLGLSTAVRESK
ncbi:MAG: ATP-NAD kinase family protein [Pseudomonadota bacterium]